VGRQIEGSQRAQQNTCDSEGVGEVVSSRMEDNGDVEGEYIIEHVMFI
jgi:hypothetical protein